MAVQRLRIHDIIVDLIPGLLFLILLFSLLPINPESLLSYTQLGLGTGLVVLLISYAAGRFLHTIAARPLVERFRKSIWDKTIHRFESYPNSEPEFSAYISEACESKNSKSVLEKDDRKSLIRLAEEEFSVTIETTSPSTDENGDGWENDLAYFEYICQSMLADRSGLYHTYVILVTFFRSIWLVTVIGSITYLLTSSLFLATNSLWIQLLPFPEGSLLQPGLELALIGLFVVASFLASGRRMEFKHQRVRAMINDVYLRLVEEDLPQRAS